MVAPADEGHKLMKLIFIQKIKFLEHLRIWHWAIGPIAISLRTKIIAACCLNKKTANLVINYGRFRCLLANTFSPEKRKATNESVGSMHPYNHPKVLVFMKILLVFLSSVNQQFCNVFTIIFGSPKLFGDVSLLLNNYLNKNKKTQQNPLLRQVIYSTNATLTHIHPLRVIELARICR
jgi:hypothetical protein